MLQNLEVLTNILICLETFSSKRVQKQLKIQNVNI